jgi:hypothetical protein
MAWYTTMDGSPLEQHSPALPTLSVVHAREMSTCILVRVHGSLFWVDHTKREKKIKVKPGTHQDSSVLP